MEVGIQVTGNGPLPGTEATFTSNVSSRGARILSTRRWRINDRLTIATLSGSFRSVARVAYCQPEPQLSAFAVGIEFLDPKGSWVVTSPHSAALLTR
jgi:hypothetical protein